MQVALCARAQWSKWVTSQEFHVWPHARMRNKQRMHAPAIEIVRSLWRQLTSCDSSSRACALLSLSPTGECLHHRDRSIHYYTTISMVSTDRDVCGVSLAHKCACACVRIRARVCRDYDALFSMCAHFSFTHTQTHTYTFPHILRQRNTHKYAHARFTMPLTCSHTNIFYKHAHTHIHSWCTCTHYTYKHITHAHCTS